MSWTVYTEKQKLISEKKNTFLFYFDPKKTEDSHKLPTFIFAHWFVVPHRYYCQGAGSLTQHFVYFAIMILLLSIRPLCVLVVLLWFVSCARLVPMSVSSLTPVSSLSVSVSVCFLFYFDGLLSCVQCVQFCLPRLIMFVHLSYVPMLRWTAFPYSPLCVFVPCIFFTLLDCLSIFLPSFRFSMPLVWCCMPYVPCS